MPKKVHCPLCFTLTDLAWLAQHGQNEQIVSINIRPFLNQIQIDRTYKFPKIPLDSENQVCGGATN